MTTRTEKYIKNLNKTATYEVIKFAKHLADVGYSYGRICQLVNGLEDDNHYAHNRAIDLWIQIEGNTFVPHALVGTSSPAIQGKPQVLEELAEEEDNTEEEDVIEDEEIIQDEIIEEEEAMSLLDWVNLTLGIPQVDQEIKLRIIAEVLDSVSVK